MPILIKSQNLKTAKTSFLDEKAARYVKDFGIKPYDAGVLTSSLELTKYFESMLDSGASAKGSLTWLTTELLGRLKGENTLQTCGIDSTTLATLVKRIDESKISGKSGKEILDVLVENRGGDVDSLIESMGLAQVNDDGAILAAIDSVLSANPDKVAEFKNGKDKLFGFFVGQVMKTSKGANPARVDESKISGKSGKEILDVLVENRGGDVDSLIDSMGLAQVNDDGAILAAIDSVLSANPDKVAEFKSGKDKLFGFFVGQVMKASKGANPTRVNELLKEKLQ